MSKNQNQLERFNALLSRLIEEQLTSQEIDELLSLARSDAELKSSLRKQLEMDELLRLSYQHDDAIASFVESVMQEAEHTTKETRFEHQVLSSLEQGSISSLKTSHSSVALVAKNSVPWLVSLGSIAASVFFVLLILFQQNKAPLNTPGVSVEEIKDSGVAIIANAVAVHVDEDFRSGMSLLPGSLVLSQGFLELEFYHGAQLKIEAPASLDIINAQHVKLHYGRVMTEVPEVAIGFTIDTPQSSIVDLGTAIGVEVDRSGASQVHVFDGLIEARNSEGVVQRVEEGQAISFTDKGEKNWKNKMADVTLFKSFKQIAVLNSSLRSLKHQQWLMLKEKLLKDDTLVAYYDFELNNQKPRLLNNIADAENLGAGAIVGARWGDGPWPGKSALEFKRPGDRIRIDLKDKFVDFTLAAWVQLDSLDRTYNSLLLTDGFKPGDIHWQLGDFSNKHYGTLVLGLVTKQAKELHFNFAPFFTPAESGTWYHLATTVNQKSKRVKMYVNGELVYNSPLPHKSAYWQIGKASIGNWNSQQRANPLRNLNGAMAELMVFNRSLNASELNELALARSSGLADLH